MKKNRRGFTMVEVLVVMAIIVVVGLVSFINLYPTRNRVSVTGAAQQMVATLRQAQSRAISQYNNTAWGVHFDNTDPSKPFYSLFSSGSYSSSTAAETYPLPYNINFFPGDVPEGSSTDIVFSSLSGKASAASLVTSLWGKYTGEIGDWHQTAPLPLQIAGQGGAYYNGYLYSLGGATWPYTQTWNVYYAQTNADGTISPWAMAASPLPSDAGNVYQGAVAYKGYLYNVGGINSYATSPVVYYAKINADGSLGSWIRTASLPQGVESPAVAAYNGYLYSLGGILTAYHGVGAGGNGVDRTDRVYYAKINADGSIQPWSETSYLFDEATYLPTVAYKGYLYSLGGNFGSGYYRAFSSYAKINTSDGTLQPWVQGDAFPTWWASFAPLVADNGYLYSLTVSADYSGISSLYAKVNADGSTGGWVQTGGLSSPVKDESIVASQYDFYILGGNDPLSGTQTSTVNYTPLLGPNSISVKISPQGLISF